jgi:hypothetical protein
MAAGAPHSPQETPEPFWQGKGSTLRCTISGQENLVTILVHTMVKNGSNPSQSAIA